ncbi:hypothetical protein ACTWP4_00185 [Gracilibacillus sp. D59]|uniref:hypothetical protein n=1 Tax=Gracilibacillus sp. D59 TaxID=3457434 RepID=UPI003FCCF432
MKKLLVFLLLIFVVACSSEDTTGEQTEADNKDTEEAETEEVATGEEEKENLSWQEKVKEVANSDGTETEKHDEIMGYARDYEAQEEEVQEFTDYIIKEFREEKYLMDISNHEYMLENIFKSAVIDYYYEEDVPEKSFAFDFLQNSKYNYRGVETMVSDATIENEEQMQATLAEME